MMTRMIAAALALIVVAETATAQSRIVVESAPTPEAYAEMLGVDLSPTTTARPASGLRMRGIQMHSNPATEAQGARPAAETARVPQRPMAVSSNTYQPTTSERVVATTAPQMPVIVTAPVKFGLDSAHVPSSFELYLDNLAVVLRAPDAAGRVLIISGHTDSQGSSEYNQLLSERRAAAVERYLVNQGVRRDQLISFGKGESDLLSGREANHALNRRVEFRLTN